MHVKHKLSDEYNDFFTEGKLVQVRTNPLTRNTSKESLCASPFPQASTPFGRMSPSKQ